MSGGNPPEGRRWPGYLFGGRARTSTVVLILVFLGAWWIFETYQPEPAPPLQIPATDVVPPGFIPDPAYTWVPRTDVQLPTTTTTTPTTPTTTTTPTTPTSGEEAAPTTTGEPGSAPDTPGAATTTAPRATATSVAPSPSGVPTTGPTPAAPTP